MSPLSQLFVLEARQLVRGIRVPTVTLSERLVWGGEGGPCGRRVGFPQSSVLLSASVLAAPETQESGSAAARGDPAGGVRGAGGGVCRCHPDIWTLRMGCVCVSVIV